jgi:hypothetical protein
MHRGFLRALGLVFVLTLAAGEARAQYYPGYGHWGWGGWGGAGSTVQGSIAQGLGYYNMGAGIYNEQTAEAASINADTIMRWNQFMFAAQQEANRREYLRRAREIQRSSQTGDAILKRLRENPDAHDIETGDALNAILDQLTNPKIHSSSLRMAKAPVPGKAIRGIPFQNATEAVTLSLDQLTGEEVWPLALRGETFAPERKAYQDAIDKAVKEDEEGTLSSQTLQNVDLAASRLRAKLEANKPEDRNQHLEAVNYIKGLLGMARMLQKPQVDKILAELDPIKETTLGSLLGFMHTYNLRFAPATTPQQREIYTNLYPLMSETRDRILKEVAGGESNGGTPLARSNPRSASDFFQGMHLENLAPRSNRNPTNP